MKVVNIFWSLTYWEIETMLVNIANAQAVEGAEVYLEEIIEKIYY